MTDHKGAWQQRIGARAKAEIVGAKMRLEKELANPLLEARLEELAEEQANPLSYFTAPSPHVPKRWRVVARKGWIELDATGTDVAMTLVEYIVTVNQWRIRGRQSEDEVGCSGVARIHLSENDRGLVRVTFTSPECEELRLDK